MQAVWTPHLTCYPYLSLQSWQDKTTHLHLYSERKASAVVPPAVVASQLRPVDTLPQPCCPYHCQTLALSSSCRLIMCGKGPL